MDYLLCLRGNVIVIDVANDAKTQARTCLASHFLTCGICQKLVAGTHAWDTFRAGVWNALHEYALTSQKLLVSQCAFLPQTILAVSCQPQAKTSSRTLLLYKFGGKSGVCCHTCQRHS